MFRGGVRWKISKRRFWIHLPCHTSTSWKQVTKSSVKSPAVALFGRLGLKVAALRVALSFFLFLLYFEDLPLAELTWRSHSLFMIEKSVRVTSYLAFLSFFKFFCCYQSYEMFFKKEKVNKNVCNIRKKCCIFMVFSYFTQCLLKFAYLSQFHNLITGNAVKSVTTHLFFWLKWLKMQYTH